MWGTGTSLRHLIYKSIFQVWEIVFLFEHLVLFLVILCTNKHMHSLFSVLLSLQKWFTIVEFCNSTNSLPTCNTNVVQQQVTRTPRNVVFKGICLFQLHFDVCHILNTNTCCRSSLELLYCFNMAASCSWSDCLLFVLCWSALFLFYGFWIKSTIKRLCLTHFSVLFR